MIADERVEETTGVSALGRALVIVGDAWSVRIVRSLFVGHRSFGGLRETLGISDAVLAGRLAGLVDDGVITHPGSDQGARRNDYLLTEAGKDLWRVMVAIRSWDQSWAGAEHPDAAIELLHHACGQSTHPVLGCGSCGAIGLRARDVIAVADEHLLREVKATRSRRLTHPSGQIDSSRVLGDHWSTLVLACALMGDTQFQEFQNHLGISPGTLTSRLKDFVDSGILERGEQRVGSKRQVYRLTPSGLDFFPVAAMLNDWSRRWLAADGHSGLAITHNACRSELAPQFTCNSCNGVLKRKDVSFRGTNLEGADHSPGNLHGPH